MPATFAVAHFGFADPQVDLFAAFGSFALLLLVEFPGRPRTRLASYVGLFLVGSLLVRRCSTVASSHPVVAVLSMGVVGFAVLFAGIVSPPAATASTAALLTFVLPVAVVQPPGAVGPRLLGWTLAGAFCLPACLVIWPPPWHDNLRRRLSATVAALARAARQRAEGGDDLQAEVTAQVSSLRTEYAATPYPPTGTAGVAVAVAKLVSRVEWVAGNLAQVAPQQVEPEHVAVRARRWRGVADTLQQCSTLICDERAHPVDDPHIVGAVQESTRRLDRLIGTAIDTEVSHLIDTGAGEGDGPDRDREDSGGTAGHRAESGVPDGHRAESGGPDGHGGELAAALVPTFHARGLAIATELVADAVLEASGAEPVGDRDQGMADQRSGPLWRRLASHLTFRSVWFRNALRGAAGLALAVAVVEVTDVGHGFWVVLGTLSVLRSSAFGTGSTALRAVVGTAVGFVLGSVIMIGVGNHTAALWVLLPVAVALSGAAPSMISFAAGQAAFTLVVIILFNIIEPSGWRVGLTRIEDVAIGCAVSVVVGLLFWPRGATAALGRALADAFSKSSAYLADAVSLITSSTGHVDTAPAERAAHSAYFRLDDVFRQFLTERGAKVVPVETVATLFTGSNRLRLAAFTLATLPELATDDAPELESVAVAGAVLRDAYASSHRWYLEFAELLSDRRDALDEPPAHDVTLDDVMRGAFDDALSQGRDDRLHKTLRMLWADELLESLRQVQLDLGRSADLFVRRGRRLLI